MNNTIEQIEHEKVTAAADWRRSNCEQNALGVESLMSNLVLATSELQRRGYSVTYKPTYLKGQRTHFYIVAKLNDAELVTVVPRSDALEFNVTHYKMNPQERTRTSRDVSFLNLLAKVDSLLNNN